MREYFDRRGRNGSYTPFVGGEMLLVYTRLSRESVRLASAARPIASYLVGDIDLGSGSGPLGGRGRAAK